MAGRIPSQFIDQLLSQADIVDIINARIPLKKAGREFQACCPFHHEKTPSFTVSPTKQFYHCFGCGAHGSAISFLMEYDNLAFPDAVEEVARQVGIEVPRDNNDHQGPDYRPLYDLLEQCQKLYSWQLRHHPDAPKAVEYLKQRGLSGEVAATYHIGYAPSGWDNLLKEIGKNDTQISQLIETGMVTKNENKQYDRFRDRIMFPIRDRRGRVIGFGGRILGDEKPKYLNSPETPVFHKGRELYGLYEARQAQKQIDRLLVVEGYMDVVAVAQFGINYAVATLGTATTDQHLELIFRTTQHAVFCFDGDRAGKAAAWKALETALPHMRDGKQASFLFLPDGEDPDTLIRKEGKAAFEERINNALPLSEYLFEKIAEQVDMRSLDGKAHFAELIKPHLERLPEGIFKDMMMQKRDETIGIHQQGQASPREKFPRADKKQSKTGLNTIPPVRRAIALMLHFPAECTDTTIAEDFYNSDHPGLPLFCQIHDFIAQHPETSLGSILEHWRGTPESQHLHKISQLELDILPEDVTSQFEGIIRQIQKMLADHEWQALLQNKSPGQLTDREKKRLQELQSLRNIKSDN